MAAAALAATLLAGPVGGQEPQQESRIGTTWFPAFEVLNPDGTLTPEFATPRELPQGDVTAQDYVLVLGKRVAKWQQESWEHAGRASDLGLKDGTVMLDDRSPCSGNMESVRVYRDPTFAPPREFTDWAARAEAILEVEVSRISPGFNRWGEPEMLVTVNLTRHLFEPTRLFPGEMRLLLPVGEFVAGDAVFCRRETWGRYRPRTGDRLLVGAFLPSRDTTRLLTLDRPTQVFVVGQEGELRRLGGKSADDAGFPVSLLDFVAAVRQLDLEGALEEASLYETHVLEEAERRANKRAEAGEKRESDRQN
ncbi:MAG: hypothetical protein OXG11_11865 [Chloroflexi bacterium]|nr:hypothetical protein [Chloroflexota bacterium]